MQQTNLEVYSSGVPYFFTYGVCVYSHNTYSLINNQYWVKSSTNFSNEELSEMIFLDVMNGVWVRD